MRSIGEKRVHPVLPVLVLNNSLPNRLWRFDSSGAYLTERECGAVKIMRIILFGLLAVLFAALLTIPGLFGAASAASPENLKACIETATRCRERCQGSAPCGAACQRSFKQCKLWETETQPASPRDDTPRNSVMPR
jgi:hypothetical protein